MSDKVSNAINNYIIMRPPLVRKYDTYDFYKLKINLSSSHCWSLAPEPHILPMPPDKWLLNQINHSKSSNINNLSGDFFKNFYNHFFTLNF